VLPDKPLKQGNSPMRAAETPEDIDQGRSRLLGAATMSIAAAGTAIAVVLAISGGRAISA
jgi:hypothetical protein